MTDFLELKPYCAYSLSKILIYWALTANTTYLLSVSVIWPWGSHVQRNQRITNRSGNLLLLVSIINNISLINRCIKQNVPNRSTHSKLSYSGTTRYFYNCIQKAVQLRSQLHLLITLQYSLALLIFDKVSLGAVIIIIKANTHSD